MEEGRGRRANTQKEGDNYVLVPPTEFNINSPNLRGASKPTTPTDSNINLPNVGEAPMKESNRMTSSRALSLLHEWHASQKKEKKKG